jgi:hypothetical protein
MPFRLIRTAIATTSAAVATLLVAASASAQTEIHYPQLRGFHPVAAKGGATSELELRSSNDLRGASQVIVVGDGVTGEIVPPAPPPADKNPPPPLLSLKIKFTVASDALPGPRQVRLLTPRGASTLAEIVIVRDAVVMEAPDNNTLDKAQPLPSLPATVCGLIEAKEDVDYFRFHLDAPQSLVFHVWAQRLQHTLNDLRGRRFIDPILTLRTASGATLASSDNVFTDDPFLVHRFTQPGDYVLEIRDVRYHGWGDYWGYAIEIHPRPFVAQPFPLAVKPGTGTALTLVGANLPGETVAAIALPELAAYGVHHVATTVGDQPSNAFAVVATRLPIVLEAATGNNTPDVAPVLAIPACIAGRIEIPGDIDCWRFEAKKGEQFSFSCTARQAGSPLDGALRILNAKGEQLVETDDTRYSLFTMADPELEGWTAAEDGTYTLEFRDSVSAGGPEFGYALSVTRSEPKFRLEANSDKTLLAPGVASPIYVRVDRRNGFTGEVQLAVEGLPAGVSAECGRILPKSQDGVIILKAAADARAGAANIRITGTATHTLADGTSRSLSAVARPLSEIMQDGGGRGLVPVSTHIVSIADPMVIRNVSLASRDLALKPGESKKVEIRVERAAGYKGNITLDALFQHLGVFGDSLPPGVTVDTGASLAILTGDVVAGHLTLKAAADALPVTGQLVPMMAHVTLNFTLKLTFCESLRITVESAAK